MKSPEGKTNKLLNSDGHSVGPTRRKALNSNTVSRISHTTLQVKGQIYFDHTLVLTHSCNLENGRLSI